MNGTQERVGPVQSAVVCVREELEGRVEFGAGSAGSVNCGVAAGVCTCRKRKRESRGLRQATRLERRKRSEE